MVTAMMNMEIYLEKPMPGFPELAKLKLRNPEANIPFFFLDSEDDSDISFIAIHTFDIFPEYEFSLPELEKELLNLQSDDKVYIFSIVNWRGGIQNATVNLKAPLIVNERTRKAAQVILHDEQFLIAHPLLPHLKGEL